MKPTLLLLLFVLPVSANWMYLGIVGVSAPLQQHEPQPGPEGSPLPDPELMEARAICGSLPGHLVRHQLEVCVSNPTAIFSIADGARRGINQCQYQFRHERWNCSIIDNDQTVFGYILQQGSKETAFIYAVTSAGVVHAITHACSSGNLTDCSCDARKHGQTTPQGWKWGGCSDNLQYGIKFARRFVDAPEKIRPANIQENSPATARTSMNLHNNEAGRQVVSALMRMQCRCHGVSGSCELKTCWKTMPSFNEVGEVLKKKYRQAVLLPKKVQSKTRRNLRRKNKFKRRLPAGKGELVHIHKSPNYCVYDSKRGIAGTSGRLCNKTSTDSDSCDLLCCGRGYNTQVMKHIERCHCKFIWCCYVQCKTCETQIDRHTCK